MVALCPPVSGSGKSQIEQTVNVVYLPFFTNATLTHSPERKGAVCNYHKSRAQGQDDTIRTLQPCHVSETQGRKGSR